LQRLGKIRNRHSAEPSVRASWNVARHALSDLLHLSRGDGCRLRLQAGGNESLNAVVVGNQVLADPTLGNEFPGEFLRLPTGLVPRILRDGFAPHGDAP